MEADAVAMGEALLVARAKWPTVTLSHRDFALYLQQIGAATAAVESHGADLALACACAQGDEDALLVFERTHVAAIPSYVHRLHLSPEQVQELQQLVRVKLFTGASRRILRYQGKGPLNAWVCILSLRLAIDELAARPREAGLATSVLDSLVSDTVGPEEGAIRSIWRARFREAIEASLAELPVHEKTILRLHYVEALNIDSIGAIYQVHRATVARWLLAIRASVLAHIRNRFSMVLPSTTSELRSLFQDLQSELRVSISRVLGQPPDEATVAERAQPPRTT